MLNDAMQGKSFADDQLIGVPQVMGLLGFKSRNSVDAAEAAGNIPKSMRISGSRRWRLGSVKAALARLEQEATGRVSVDPLG